LKNLYEGLFIFAGDLDGEKLDEMIERLRKEVADQGGQVRNVTRLGKRTFARPLKKLREGYYYVVVFDMEGSRVQVLRDRLKMLEGFFRVNIVKSGKEVGENEGKRGDERPQEGREE